MASMPRISCPHDYYKTMIPPTSNNNPTPKLERLLFRHVPGFDQPLATDYHPSGPLTESTPFDPFCRTCQTEVSALFRSFGIHDEINNLSLQQLQEDVVRMYNGGIDHDIRLIWRVESLISRPYDNYDEDVVRAWVERVSFEEATETPTLSASKEATVALKRSIIKDDEKTNCTICLEEMNAKKDGTTLKIEMPCKHEFHEECILEWLKMSHRCPLCRFELPSSSSAKNKS